MYSQPTIAKDNKTTSQKQEDLLKPLFHNTSADDDAVKAFKNKFKSKLQDEETNQQNNQLESSHKNHNENSSSSSSSSDLAHEKDERKKSLDKVKSHANFSSTAVQSKLEKEVSKRYNPGLTQQGRSHQTILYYCIIIHIIIYNLKFYFTFYIIIIIFYRTRRKIPMS